MREAAARLGDRDAWQVLRDFMVTSNVWTLEKQEVAK